MASSKANSKSQPVRSQPVVQSRVIVTESVTHVGPKGGGGPQTVTVGHVRLLTTDEAPYLHPGASLRVGKNWTAVPLGWLEDPVESRSNQPQPTEAGDEPDGPPNGSPNVSEIVLENTEGRDVDHIPTPEEAERLARRVLQVGFTSLTLATDMWEDNGEAPPHRAELLVPPGDMLRLKPVNVRTVRLRCQDPSQTVRVSCLLIPK